MSIGMIGVLVAIGKVVVSKGGNQQLCAWFPVLRGFMVKAPFATMVAHAVADTCGVCVQQLWLAGPSARLSLSFSCVCGSGLPALAT